MNKRGVIYARFSSHNQRDESIEQQIAEAREFAQRNKIDIIDIYADAAKSGKGEKQRREYQRMLRDAKKDKFDVIIAYKSSRISRNMIDALMFEERMDKLNIKTQFVKEEFGDNAAGRYMLRSMMNLNQFHSENMAEDIKRNQHYNALDCKVNGNAPFGYKTGDDGKFAVDEFRADIVREIFQKYLNGVSFTEIANNLNLRGIKTAHGNLWNKCSFKRLLTNERYTGVYIFDDVRVEGGMPVIIEKSTFDEVQYMLQTKKNPQGRNRSAENYILTGKLICGECGEYMIGMSGKSKNGTVHYYYACGEKRRTGKCKKKNVRKDFIEHLIAKTLNDYILQDDVIEWIADAVEAIQKKQNEDPEMLLLKTQLDETQKKIQNMLKALEMGISTESTQKHMIALETQYSKISEQIFHKKQFHFTVPKEAVREWLHSFKKGDVDDPEYQDMIISTFLSKAYVYDNNLKLIIDAQAGNSRAVDVAIDDSAPSAECSIKDALGSPNITESNTLMMISGMFVLTVKL